MVTCRKETILSTGWKLAEQKCNNLHLFADSQLIKLGFPKLQGSASFLNKKSIVLISLKSRFKATLLRDRDRERKRRGKKHRI